MAFSNTIASWMAGDGIPYMYSSNINLNNNVPVNFPSPFGTSFTLKPRAGYVRIKTNGTARINVTTKVGVITATDGTNVVNLYAGDANPTAPNGYYDSTFFFWYDWAVANINITNIATTLNTQTYDVEVVGLQ